MPVNNIAPPPTHTYPMTSHGGVQVYIYSMRAECSHDALELMKVVKSWQGEIPYNYTDLRHMSIAHLDDGYEDSSRYVEFTSSLTLDQIHRCMARVPDSHIMFDTLQPLPLCENSLERINRSNPYKGN